MPNSLNFFANNVVVLPRGLQHESQTNSPAAPAEHATCVSAKNCVGRVLPSGPANLTFTSSRVRIIIEEKKKTMLSLFTLHHSGTVRLHNFKKFAFYLNELVIHEIRNNALAFSEIFFLPVVK
jgi:hypothetical protein